MAPLTTKGTFSRMNTEAIRALVKATEEKRELDRQLKVVKQTIEQLENEVCDELIEAGVQNMNVDNNIVYLHRQVWAKPAGGDYETAAAKLIEAGLEDFVQTRFNTNSVSAYVRETLATEGELPDTLNEALDITEVIKPRVKKG